MDYKEIITLEPGKRGGEPTIRGMRITVYDVLECLGTGMTEQQILADFPYLTRDDILACLQFAASRERGLLAVQPRRRSYSIRTCPMSQTTDKAPAHRQRGVRLIAERLASRTDAKTRRPSPFAPLRLGESYPFTYLSRFRWNRATIHAQCISVYWRVSHEPNRAGYPE
jgi:uncharacterized protein (DUF433 family)